MPSMNVKEFKTSKDAYPKVASLGSLQVTTWPDVPQVEFRILGKWNSCVLKGEDIKEFLQWLKENLSDENI